MNTVKRLRALFREIVREAEANPTFAEQLMLALDVDQLSVDHPKPVRLPADSARLHRRRPGVLDPFQVFEEGGDNGLRGRLRDLSIEQLKDIVAQHGMDSAKLAMKWRTKDRLVALIAVTVKDRSHKGDAFREHPSHRDPANV